MNDSKQRLLDKVKATVDNFTTGYLEMELGYKFRTSEFLNVLFLYINSVDTRNPDLLGATNKNTQVYEAQASIAKIKEQIRLDIKDLNFAVAGASSLARFIPKAANRKILEDNDFAEIMDEIPDNAADFGSGFLKIWQADSELKMKSVDPYHIIFDQYNFAKGLKIERIRRTYREILGDKKYDSEALLALERKLQKEDWDKAVVLFQSVQDFPDGTQRIAISDTTNDLVYYDYTTKKGEDKIVSYYKFDYKKRKGFPDALGVGCNEMIFNKLVQSKVNRERLDNAMEIATKLAFQKQIDNEHDAMVGQSAVDIDTGTILGHKGNPLSPLNTGGAKEIALLKNEINGIIQTLPNDLNVGEALMGNTLPSGTSGALGNLLTENASSVLKEVKKSYAKFLDRVYRDSIIPYILEAFDSEVDLRKYLTANDIKIVERGVRQYYIAMKYVDSVINDEPWDPALAEQEVRKEMKGKKVISGELLDQLKEEMEGIRTFISGEDISKAQAVAFLREMRANYAAAPALFRDPFYIEALKREAEFDSGMSGLEIDQLLEELPQLEQSAPQLEETTA